MAKMFGWYGDTTHVPTRIGVTCTPRESEQLTDLPAMLPPYSISPDCITHVYPADKATVGEIAKRVEVECDDGHLIDWMGKGT